MNKIFLALNITRPEREVSSFGGEGVQQGFTNMFAFFDSIRCVFFGLFTGVWC